MNIEAVLTPFITFPRRLSQIFGVFCNIVYFCTVKTLKSNSMKQKFCQSCGMPLTDDVLGTNADGTKNGDYCMYCYKDGQFLKLC